MVKRTLVADFDTYTDGDAQFKKELVGLMIGNLIELKEALDLSLTAQDFAPFREACHKVISTLDILADKEFNAVVADIKTNGSNVETAGLFNSICLQIIESLKSAQSEV